MAGGNWALDTVQNRWTCVLHGDATCVKCPPQGKPAEPTPSAGVRATPPRSLIAGEVGKIFQGKRDSVTMVNAFRAYDELLEEACSVLAIQHARIVALEQQGVDLERRIVTLEPERRR